MSCRYRRTPDRFDRASSFVSQLHSNRLFLPAKGLCHFRHEVGAREPIGEHHARTWRRVGRAGMKHAQIDEIGIARLAGELDERHRDVADDRGDRKSTRLNSSHMSISYAV